MATCPQGRATSLCRAVENQREVGHRVVRWEAGALLPSHAVSLPGCRFITGARGWPWNEQVGAAGGFLETGPAGPIPFCSCCLDLRLCSTPKDSLWPSEGRPEGFYIGRWRGRR